MRDQGLVCAESCRPEVGISCLLHGPAGHDCYSEQWIEGWELMVVAIMELGQNVGQASMESANDDQLPRVPASSPGS